MAHEVTGYISGTQSYVAANPLRDLLILQNRHDTEPLYLRLDGDSSHVNGPVFPGCVVLLPLDTVILTGAESRVAIFGGSNGSVLLSVQEG